MDDEAPDAEPENRAAVDPPAPVEDEAGHAMEPVRTGVPDTIDHAKLPVAKLAGSTPSLPARGLAFGSILIGGLCGGLIGFAFTDLQCADGCTGWAGIGALIGALVGAIGVAIVAVLVLRAMDEWETVKARDPSEHPSRKGPPA